MTRARMSRRQLMRSGAAAAAAVAFAGSAIAQTAYPNRPIRLIVPFAAGGSTDLSARLVAEFAGRELGQPIVVENKGGAGGSVGMEQVAKSDPDGYTIGMATVSTHGSNPAVYPKLKYDPIKDFAPVTNVVAIPSVLPYTRACRPRPCRSSSHWPRRTPANTRSRRPVRVRLAT